MKLLISIIFIILFVILFMYTNIIKYLKKNIINTKKEMYKITWPEYKQTFDITLIVIATVLIVSLILWFIDKIITYFLLLFFK